MLRGVGIALEDSAIVPDTGARSQTRSARIKGWRSGSRG